MAEDFSFFAYNLASGARINEIPFTKFSWSETLNGVGSFDATLPWYHPMATLESLEAGNTAIYVDQGGILRFGGIVWLVESDINNAEGVRVAGEGFWSYYNKRWLRSTQGMTFADTLNVGPTDINFTSQNQLAIVKDFIDHAAYIAGSGNVGFTAVRTNGAAFSQLGKSLTKKYSATERKTIASAVDELAKQDFAFDYSVSVDWNTTTFPWTPRRYLDLWYPRRGQSASPVVLDDGGNVTLLKLVRDATNMANPLVGIGPGVGDAAILSEQVDNTYIYPSGPYPYYEGSYAYRTDGADSLTNLQQLVQARLFLTQTPVNTASAELVSRANESGNIFSFGDVTVGDSVRVTSEAAFDLDEFMRVVRQSVTVQNTGLESWTIDLASDGASLGGL